MIAVSCLAFLASVGSAAPQAHFIPNPNPAAEAGFGMRLAQTGPALAVGVPHDTLADAPGHVDLFRRTGDGWMFSHSLAAADGFDGNGFGTLLELRGSTLFVSAPRDDDGGERSGSIYIYQLSGPTPTLLQKFRATPSVPFAQFGLDLAVSSDGNTIVAGASEETNSSGFSAGAVYIFERGEDGLFAQVARFAPPPGSSGNFFARSVAIRGDTIVVGVPGADGGQSASGRVDVYRRSGGAWSASGSVLPLVAIHNATFGQSVSLGGDRLVVSSLMPSAEGLMGRTFVFHAVGSGFAFEFEVFPEVVNANSAFGYPSLLSADGLRLTCGAMDDSSVLTGAGSVHLFTLGAGGPVQTHALYSTSPQVSETFGAALRRVGGTVWVAAPNRDAAPMISNAGAVYGFDLFASADLNEDGGVDGVDMAILLAAWGASDPSIGDVNGDGAVNGVDLSALLAAWGG